VRPPPSSYSSSRLYVAGCCINVDCSSLCARSYHLMLMPLAIRQQIPTANMGKLHLVETCSSYPSPLLTLSSSPVGFFLHIPFPSSEVYKILPCRAQLLEGVLSCDLVGFHTWDYSEHFVKTCTRILGAETEFQAVIYRDRRVPG
jgi:trehalose-6-phosphate synthase